MAGDRTIAIYTRALNGAERISRYLPSKPGSLEHWGARIGDGYIRDLALVDGTKSTKCRLAQGKVTIQEGEAKVTVNGEVPQTLIDISGRMWRLHPNMIILHTSWDNYQVDAAASAAIEHMNKRGFYGLTTNNCHRFVLYMLRALEQPFPSNGDVYQGNLAGSTRLCDSPSYTITTDPSQPGLLCASDGKFSFQWRLGESSKWIRTPLRCLKGVIAPSRPRTTSNPPYSAWDRKSTSNLPPERIRYHHSNRLGQSARRPRGEPSHRRHRRLDNGTPPEYEDSDHLEQGNRGAEPYGIGYNESYARHWYCSFCTESVLDGTPILLTFHLQAEAEAHWDQAHWNSL